MKLIRHTIVFLGFLTALAGSPALLAEGWSVEPADQAGQSDKDAKKTPTEAVDQNGNLTLMPRNPAPAEQPVLPPLPEQPAPSAQPAQPAQNAIALPEQPPQNTNPPSEPASPNENK